MGTPKPFHERVAAINGTASKSATAGFKNPLFDSGLVVNATAKPKRKWPWKSMILAGVLLIGLKGFFYAQFGQDLLEARIAELNLSPGVNRVVAWVLQPDPLSGWAAYNIYPVLPNPEPR